MKLRRSDAVTEVDVVKTHPIAVVHVDEDLRRLLFDDAVRVNAALGVVIAERDLFEGRVMIARAPRAIVP